jgi:hypothetical protein
MPAVNPPQLGFPTFTLGNYGVAMGAEVDVATGGGTAYGAWTALGTLSQAIDRLDLILGGTSSRLYFLDLRVAGTTFFSSRAFRFQATNVPPIRIEQHIPSGLLEARAAGSAASTLKVGPLTYASNVAQDVSILEPIGTTAVNPLSVGTNVPATGAWTALTASPTGVAYKRFEAYLDTAPDTGRIGANNYTVDIATANDGSGILASFFVESNTGYLNSLTLPQFIVPIPADSNLFARITPVSSTSGSLNDPVNVQLYGVR